MGQQNLQKHAKKKYSVSVIVDEPIWNGERNQEFWLQQFDCALMWWGQGDAGPIDDWKLDPEDAKKILEGGGG